MSDLSQMLSRMSGQKRSLDRELEASQKLIEREQERMALKKRALDKVEGGIRQLEDALDILKTLEVQCCVCLEQDTSTTYAKLDCPHTLCLGCFSEMRDKLVKDPKSTLYAKSNEMCCPQCREEITALKTARQEALDKLTVPQIAALRAERRQELEQQNLLAAQAYADAMHPVPVVPASAARVASVAAAPSLAVPQAVRVQMPAEAPAEVPAEAPAEVPRAGTLPAAEDPRSAEGIAAAIMRYERQGMSMREAAMRALADTHGERGMIAMDIALGETGSTVDEESALEDSDEENMPAHISAVIAANEAATAAHQVLYNARNQAAASGSPQDAAAAEAASQQAQAADAALEAADAVAAAYSAAAAPPS